MTITAAPAANATASKARWRARVRWSVLLLTSLGVVGYAVANYAEARLPIRPGSHGLSATYAHRPIAIQVAFYTHIMMASLALLAGPFQFSTVLRVRFPAVHRWSGRVYVLGVAVGSVAAVVMSFASSIAFDGFFGFGGLAALWAWATWRGYRAIRDRDLPSHRAWMIRSFALAYAAVTLRAWLGVLILVQVLTAHGSVDGTRIFNNAYAPLPFLSWLPNLVIAELMIRRRGLPAYRLTPAATAAPAVRSR
ncbi:DUF2306 domain-containing protein [Streptomyces alanosinicus]|uniref:DUF2306 domain-containing protein n=1 Tax=Streptomyces alanosinicus TaxID=68171 RepID=A0A918YRK6_9ACTN|nr:DUF2306 domain-containing protein [Streptomyces alanosinicus]GHE12566.1 hypothetical protein GCM10010339_76280 [Streptomyces alanosinicus]